jgi:subtilisin
MVGLQIRPGLQAAQMQDGVEDPGNSMQVLHALHEDGPKLVEMSAEAELNLRTEVPGLKIVPVVEYQKMNVEHHVQRTPSPPAVAASTRTVGVSLRILDAVTEKPLAGAKVIAFTDFRHRAGDEGVSDSGGSVRLRIADGTKLDRLYVYGPARYWGHFSRGLPLTSGHSVALQPVDLTASSLLLARFRASVPPDAGNGVVVGIVDSGIAKQHPALPNVAGGANLVFDEIRDDPGEVDSWGPAATDGEHGTHVAGIVGARPTPAVPLSGVAPGVQIRSYRVFPHSGGGATNYDIMNAIDRAVLDGCHIINLSLGGGAEDEAVRASIGAALDAGAIVVAAAGNDSRRPVSFPAALTSCVAVSAAGRRGTFPDDSSEAADIVKPFGDPDGDHFLAGFSNFGPTIDLTGPGLGIVSTLPEDNFGVMSGTSMACPAVAAFAAYLLAADRTILDLSGPDRSKALKEKLYKSAKPLGFGRDYEGFGLPS